MSERPIRLTGRVFVGQVDASGKTIYREIRSESDDRPDDWRGKQARTPLRNILTGK